jgi:hypothetical protein
MRVRSGQANKAAPQHGMLRGVKLQRLLSTLLLEVLAACSSLPTAPEQPSPVADSTQREMPAEVLNPDVHQDTIRQTLCTPGYTASVRPSTTYTNGIKLKLMREQEIPAPTASAFELDHRIPLGLGGHPRTLKNLALQPCEGEDGAKKKDQLERRSQRLVGAGRLLLDDARRAIFFDWRAAYRRYVMAP